MFNYSPLEIKEYLDKHVIGQEKAKYVLAVATYNHYKRIQYPELGLEKSNVLLIGPSGCGKTLLVKSLAKLFNVPFAIADATSLTATGYVGGDVEDILSSLYNSNSDNKAEHGIVFIDEIDKIRKRNGVGATDKDIGGEAVQQSLLKLIEGSKVKFNKEGQHRSGDRTGDFDTTNVLFICGGAFVGLENPANPTSENLISYGLIPEFLGRIPNFACLSELSRDELLRTLTEPKQNIVDQFKRLLKSDNVTLVFTNECLESIVERALSQKVGARGLRKIIEGALLMPMFNLQSNKNRPKITVTLSHIDAPLAIAKNRAKRVKMNKNQDMAA